MILLCWVLHMLSANFPNPQGLATLTPLDMGHWAAKECPVCATPLSSPLGPSSNPV